MPPQNKKLFLFIILLIACLNASEPEIKKSSVKIIAVGDIMMGGSSEEIMLREGYDYPFKNVQDILKSGDIVIGNLECPVTDGGTPFKNKRFVFKMKDSAILSLKQFNFSLFSLANNHILDFGEEGLMDTINALEKYGIGYAGAGSNLFKARAPAIEERNGLRFGFLSYTLTLPDDFFAEEDKPGTAFGREEFLKEDIKNLRKNVDIVIVAFHWGKELSSIPEEYQVYTGHLAINYGADIVLGHHPHTLQGIELYKDGIIFYSLGNFIFGSYSRNVTDSIIAIIDVEKENYKKGIKSAFIKKIELIPINVFNPDVVFQPKIYNAEDALMVIKKISDLSTGVDIKFSDSMGIIDLMKIIQ